MGACHLDEREAIRSMSIQLPVWLRAGSIWRATAVLLWPQPARRAIATAMVLGSGRWPPLDFKTELR